jgi:hypothetical protein
VSGANKTQRMTSANFDACGRFMNLSCVPEKECEF